MQHFPLEETSFLLAGPVGDLEVLATPAPVDNTKNITVVICHPHPLFGGTMTNKVVSTLARAFRNLGLQSIRFNFRGVGKSAGHFDDGRGEAQDLSVVIDWVKQTRPQDTLWLAGFSFGGYIAAKVASQDETVQQLVSVAPQVSRFLQDKFVVSASWIIVQGDKDEVVSPTEVFAWVETLTPQPTLIKIEGAGHFFHGKLIELRERLELSLS